jgi:hypothetical protein
LLDGLQNGTHRGKAGAADQSARVRVGLRTVCGVETSRINISMESSREKKIYIHLSVEENYMYLFIEKSLQ